MKKKNIIISVILAGFTSVMTSSCTDWLDVKMSDNIMENTLYSTNDGFLIALNGIYVGLNDVYGRDLSVGVIDVMAQYYNVTENNDHAYKIYAGYKFEEDAFERTSSNLWTKMYENIANINALLDHCDEEGSALRKSHYSLVKGEALALRAMLHFDLLRIYGPVPQEETASQTCIPYQESSVKDIQPLLPASQVIEKVIRDLEAAAAILKEGDPIITKGVQNAVPSDDGLDRYDFAYRQLRLNYYAVQVLLARAYLWKGDKAKASQIAKNEILDKITTTEVEVFPWITEKAIQNEKKPDRLFSTEVFFSLYDQARSSMYSNLFNSSLEQKSRLTFVGQGIASADSKITTFYDDASNDWRVTTMWDVVTVVDKSEGDDEEGKEGEEETPKTKSSLYSKKYMDPERDATFDGSETYRYMTPLIRLSEVYLILAECAQTDDEAISYINKIRSHRNCRSVTEQDGDRQTLVTKEFAREVLGEGQLFFYYKRLGMESIISGISATEPYNMLLGNYVWPLPKVEIDKRGTVEL